MQAKKLLPVLLVGAAIVAAGMAGPQVPEPKLSDEHPLWQADLHGFGYVEPSGRDLSTIRFSQGPGSLHNKLDFTGNDQLAWAWLTLDNSPIPAQKSKKKGPPHRPQPEAAHLHVLFLDARTGQRIRLQEWSTPSFPLRFFGIGDGKFLICTGNILRVFSPSFEVLHEQDFLTGSACTSLKISPSRRTLYVSYSDGEIYRSELWDTAVFSTITSWTEEKTNRASYILSIADESLVSTCGQPPQICVRRIDQAWHPFKPAGLDDLIYDPQRASAAFVNDSILAITAWNQMAVATTEGSVLFQMKLSKNRSFTKPVASSGGEMFAVIENRQRGLTNESLDMYAFLANDRVVVYSIPDRHAVYALKLRGTSPWAPWEPHLNQVALSPDGTLLAVESDGVLKVYRLPGGNIAQH